jgi:cytochrome b561
MQRLFAIGAVLLAVVGAFAYGALRLPRILPQDPTLYWWLRQLHSGCAYLLFAVFVAHLGAALLHVWIRRDGVFASMAPWRAGGAPRP